MEIILKHKDEDYNDVESKVDITFISHRMSNKYGEIQGKLYQIQTLHPLIVNEKENRRKIKKEDKENVAEYDEKMKAVREVYSDVCSVEFLNERYDFIISVLKANKVEDKKLLTREFYDEYVHPQEINDFMTALITQNKKKV